MNNKKCKISFSENIEWMIIHGLFDKRYLTQPRDPELLPPEKAILYLDLAEKVSKIGKLLDSLQSCRPRIKSPDWVSKFYEVAALLCELELTEPSDRPNFVRKMMRCILPYFGFKLRSSDTAYGSRCSELIKTAWAQFRSKGGSLQTLLQETGFIEKLFKSTDQEDTSEINKKLRLKDVCSSELGNKFPDFVRVSLIERGLQFN